MKFSVLMSVYDRESSLFLKAALESLMVQSLLPNEIILVEDGPINSALRSTISSFSETYPNILVSVRLPENQGLGNALNVGIKHAKNELIARMDSDDIAMRDRFEKQIAMFENDSELAVCSGHVAEFVNNIDNVVAYRRVPIMHEEIIKYLRRRSPFNHPAVMYKKSAIIEVSGYPKTRRSEDYYLWVNLLIKGYKGGNVNDTLLYFRASDFAYQRKRSIANTVDSINMHLYAYRHHAAGLSDLVIVSAAHIFLLTTPLFITKLFYRKVLR